LVQTCVGEYCLPYSEYPNINFDFQIIIKVAKEDLRPTIHNHVPSSVKEQIKNLWNPKPQLRHSIVTLLESFKELEKTYLTNKESWDAFRDPHDNVLLTTDLRGSESPKTSSKRLPLIPPNLPKGQNVLPLILKKTSSPPKIIPLQTPVRLPLKTEARRIVTREVQMSKLTQSMGKHVTLVRGVLTRQGNKTKRRYRWGKE